MFYQLYNLHLWQKRIVISVLFLPFSELLNMVGLGRWITFAVYREFIRHDMFRRDKLGVNVSDKWVGNYMLINAIEVYFNEPV